MIAIRSCAAFAVLVVTLAAPHAVVARETAQEAPQQATASASHEAAATELLTLIGIDAGVAPMATRMRDTTLAQIAALDVAPGQEELARPFLEEIGAIIEQTLSWDAMRQDFVDAYTAKFSEPELIELAGFFRSPVGAKYLANVSELNRIAVDIVRENAMASAPDIRIITERMQDVLPQAEPAVPPNAGH